MTDESRDISAKSWARAADSINKVGFMDGAADGQKATFQTSFDTGYRQGFSFGMKLGIDKAELSFSNKEESDIDELKDPRKINCQICLNSGTAQDDIVNLFNHQRESNELYYTKTYEK